MSNSVLDRMYEQGRKMASSMSFVDDSVMSQIPYMRPNELDGLDFGAVQVDVDGKVEAYNRYESEITGTPVNNAMGKNFFTEVAPCTNNSLFLGAFQKGLQAGDLNLVFPYTFTYRMRPTNVLVHMYRDTRTGSNWLFVKKR